ncbi:MULTISPECIES: FAD-dependent monooxygenase [unclassified Corallococcus]|uniref:FAD-dependent monooxygenase n=1 Tax=unclassified Corallococcus TaxID=2685029 RepID=UPI001A8FE571|nr:MULTISPECIES: FAD-dependent monooxygenase [unclassified Corallococcus]MBN9684633.1 FAD-dependent monooxygenase [Corallococcus sp. NCSPR001]WAS83896.1 FAD-dependent monooxygenase [Corallococcus sp. NCRR]
MTSASPRHVLIAGAGIGGLTLACALQRAGLRATVFERAEALRPVGAGIIVQMNAAVALRRIGLCDAVVAEGERAERTLILDSTGARITAVDVRSLQEELGIPMVSVHRARLQAVLRAHAGPEEAVRLGVSVTGFEDDGARVTVTLSRGERVTGDVLVGADGLRSAVRTGLLGAQPTRYSGYTSWRGVCPGADLVEAGQCTETWGPGARFGIVPIGHGEVYWYATLNAPAGAEDAPGQTLAVLQERFAGWHAPIAKLLAATPPERVLRTDIHDRPPVRQWSRGRVTLLGDAAHPMTPNLGQGGCQAIEDGVVLAECLAAPGSVEDALRAYEARRVKRANALVVRSHQVGRVAQWENGAARFVRDALFRRVPQSAARRQLWTLVQGVR